MSISIYLNNLQVQIVVGTRGKKGKFQNSIIVTAPEGSIINGMIMDADCFTAFLTGTWAQYKLPKKDVHLVVNSNKIPGRLVDVPKLNSRKTRQFLTRELSDMQREDEESFICFNELGGAGKGMAKLYAELVSNSLVKEYMEIFSAAGISVKSIVSAEGSIIGLLEQTVAKQYKTFNMVGGVVEGKYYDGAALEELAKVPSREVLLGRLFGSMQAPVANFARVIKQIAEKDGEAPAAE